jgi:protein TonB
MLRLNSLAVRLGALGVSGAVHAAVLLSPPGHAGPDRGPGEVLPLETTDVTLLAPEVPVPEPTVNPAAGHATNWPTHTHPYPVPADHDWTPHDPNLVHPHAPANAAPEAPAQAAPALTGADDTPHFTIAIGTDDDAYGAVSAGAASGTSSAEPPHQDSGEPLGQDAVDGQARLVLGLAPSYPDAARAAGIEGDVRLELVVGVSGAVESARVVRGIGHGLDEAALRAVRQFRFAPASKAGHAVRVRMGWSVQFRLQ